MMENISYNIKDKNEEKENVNYNEILDLVDISLEEKNNKEKEDHKLALEIFYDENYRKCDLDKIAEYYRISKRKKRKKQLIKSIVNFEIKESNDYITNRRKILWHYISELENDEIMSKYIIFN